MKPIKAAIAAALSSQSALGKVVPGWPETFAVFPCTAFYRVSGSGDAADGVLAEFDELYSVDCFAKTVEAIENMELAANTAMDTLPYIVLAEHGPDLYEKDTKVHHKVLRYRIKS